MRPTNPSGDRVERNHPKISAFLDAGFPGIACIGVVAAPAAPFFLSGSLLSELEDLRQAFQSNCVPIPVRMAAGAPRRALDPASDLNLVPKVRLRGRSGRWLTLHASLTEPAPGRPSETVVIAPSELEEVAQLNVTSYGLTPREEGIMKLVARGRSTREISGTLFVSEHTVHNDLRSIFEKAGVHSRWARQAARAARRTSHRGG